MMGMKFKSFLAKLADIYRFVAKFFKNTLYPPYEIKEILIKNIYLKKSFTLKTANEETIPIKFTVKVSGREEKKIYIIIEKNHLRGGNRWFKIWGEFLFISDH